MRQGSSPRVRGTLRNEQGNVPRQGIIPACAGNTFQGCWLHSRGWDHPRVCGEHNGVEDLKKALWGSSPRVRGTPRPDPPESARPGIIPACAGNTSSARRSQDTCWDHPRVCGEHRQAFSPCPLSEGSSPRVRGTPTGHHPGTFCAGIIPACAGNTEGITVRVPFNGDHPRVCGEHAKVGDTDVTSMGSSPRVRGTLSPSPPLPGASWDHPRVCGEHQGRHHGYHRR